MCYVFCSISMFYIYQCWKQHQSVLTQKVLSMVWKIYSYYRIKEMKNKRTSFYVYGYKFPSWFFFLSVHSILCFSLCVFKCSKCIFFLKFMYLYACIKKHHLNINIMVKSCILDFVFFVFFSFHFQKYYISYSNF